MLVGLGSFPVGDGEEDGDEEGDEGPLEGTFDSFILYTYCSYEKGVLVSEMCWLKVFALAVRYCVLDPVHK